MSGRRAASAVRGLAALVTLVLLVAGLPVVLYRFGGSPVPHRIPSLHQVTSALLRRDSAPEAAHRSVGSTAQREVSASPRASSVSAAEATSASVARNPVTWSARAAIRRN